MAQVRSTASASPVAAALRGAERNFTACNVHDLSRDKFMLVGGLAEAGYDWWWHSFTGRHAQTGEEKSFFIEFFTCNPGLGGPEPVLGQLPANKQASKRPSYLMVKAGCWGKDARQLHRFFGWDEVDLGRGVPFHVAADDCLCCETDLIGRVNVSEADAAAHPEWMSDAGSMLFDLRVDKQIAFNVGFGASAPLRKLEAFDMAWHAEGIKCAYEGTVVLNGETYLVDPETCFGYADKNWGVDFTSPWVWLSSCDMTSALTGKRLENSAFDIGGGRPVVFGHALERKLLGCMNYEGRALEFNFSKVWTRSTTDLDCWETDDALYWHVVQEASGAKLVTDITCPKSEMLLINYESPDSAKRHNRLWNGGTGYGRLQLFEKRKGAYALVDDIRAGHVGCEYGEYDQ